MTIHSSGICQQVIIYILQDFTLTFNKLCVTRFSLVLKKEGV